MVGNIHIKGISKSFCTAGQAHQVLKDIEFTIYDNELLVLFGPSQCGKTVLMEIISGLIKPDAGTISTEAGTPLRTEDLCMVFQKYALFPWKTCMENVELPLKFQGMARKTRQEKAMEFLKLVGLDGFEDKYPRQLSGGMKQRVAIARAYAKGCPLLLFDEPFGALDAQTRLQMEQELLRIWRQQKKTVVLITNNIDEALLLGDRILVLDGSPASICAQYDLSIIPRPRSLSHADMLRLRSRILFESSLDSRREKGGTQHG
ncbi:MAG: ABC transporter ATP-binding protein [Clostridiales bacterium]|nr:ABC transporter ATP-binding protein [Clostridiales bacterium]